MPDPITIASVSAIVLTEGIKFLYGQASDVIKRWNDRRNKSHQEQTESKLPEKEAVALPAMPLEIFQGQLTPPDIHYAQVEKVYEPLSKLRRELLDYQDGSKPVDLRDQDLIKKVDALRRLLEIVYQQRITFKDEKRPASGPTVISNVEIKEILGEVVGIDAGKISSGATLESNVKSDYLGPGGKATGIRINNIGSDSDDVP
jgi:hypothetical protein